MQAFEVLWVRWLFVMIVSGLVLAVFYYLGFYLPSLPGRTGKRIEPEEWPQGITETSRGVPAILWLVLATIFVFSIAYFLLVWLTGRGV